MKVVSFAALCAIVEWFSLKPEARVDLNVRAQAAARDLHEVLCLALFSHYEDASDRSTNINAFDRYYHSVILY